MLIWLVFEVANAVVAVAVVITNMARAKAKAVFIVAPFTQTIQGYHRLSVSNSRMRQVKARSLSDWSGGAPA